MFIELSIHPDRPLFRLPEAKLAFARRAAAECATHDLELVAWRLVGDDAVLVLRGRERAALRYGSFVVAHHAAAHGVQGVRSVRHARVAPTVALAWGRIHRLHRGEPLADPWTSLWDGIGLRCAPWFDASMLRGVSPRMLLAEAGWAGPEPGAPHPLEVRPDASLVRAAIALVCGFGRAACPTHVLDQALAAVHGVPWPDGRTTHRAVWPTLAVLADPRLHAAARLAP